MSERKRKGLGKGINALFPDAANLEENINTSQERVVDLTVADLRPNPYQPRHDFNQNALEELAKSIKQNGVLQPIIVRKSQVKGYEIVAGERRFRASKIAGLETIPGIVRDFDEKVMMQVAILENLQREDLTALEEADAYHMMMEKLSLTQEKVAQELGKSRSYIANHLRLRSLPQATKDLLQDGSLSMGQARTLLGLKDPGAINRLAKKAVKDKLTVRQLEQEVADFNQEGKKKAKPATKPKKSIFITDIERRLTSQMDTKVTIIGKENKGKIQIEYQSLDDLNDILYKQLGLEEEP
ncbi:Probable chromosome-partitioning protein parB [Alloiococcus otitis]|uniref:ParB-like partition protein n=1 Tax=Alloiococcus otitis ATCC 51267 TaxID=883081 RepID=K9E9E1_9LACT|nr:ParB/RepB/Spo0J family partition protein [Alloiococcus otitis]EKU93829.1 ParB-like partition protein [Alloiococcus otitis ATCC 51267]SUU81805.1 Probable chromosome-partitioning protein parB [Alloiococcus otitis]